MLCAIWEAEITDELSTAVVVPTSLFNNLNIYASYCILTSLHTRAIVLSGVLMFFSLCLPAACFTSCSCRFAACLRSYCLDMLFRNHAATESCVSGDTGRSVSVKKAAICQRRQLCRGGANRRAGVSPLMPRYGDGTQASIIRRHAALPQISLAW